MALLLLPMYSPLHAGAKQKYVDYEQYGAVGDGKHDDMDAIVAAHAAANEMGVLLSFREEGRTTYETQQRQQSYAQT